MKMKNRTEGKGVLANTGVHTMRLGVVIVVGKSWDGETKKIKNQKIYIYIKGTLANVDTLASIECRCCHHHHWQGWNGGCQAKLG